MPQEGKTRRWPRRVLFGLVALVALVVAATAAGGWYFSSLLLVPEHGEDYDLRVEGAPAGRVVLEREQDTIRSGVYGLDWPGGHGILGRVRSIRDGEVTRDLRLTHGRLAANTKAAIDVNVYEGDPRQTLGIPFRRVPVRGELGVMPAWRVDGGPTWAIVVHGIDGTPEAGLRILPTLRRAGLTTLLIRYRNDPGAPRSPDGLHHLGSTEWRDLQAAARYARSQGARRLILVGQSMGGAIVTQFMERSPLARHVSGLVLDAPALSWKPILELNATERGLPAWAAVPVEWVVGLRIDVDWDRLDALDHTGDLHLPILLFHGTEDTVVPIETSEALARKLPRFVTFHRAPRAGHVESWNVGPRLYDTRLRAFLGPLRDSDESRIR